MIGKEIRLNKIIKPASGRTCLVPLDHAVTIGPVLGLENALAAIEKTNVGDADAYVVHKGVLKLLKGRKDLLAGRDFILHISASTELGNQSMYKCLTSSVEQAIRMGAIGVSMHVNLGNTCETEMLQALGITADQCYQWGMPLLVMMYVRNNQDQNVADGVKIAHAARVAQELGADIVKVSCPQNVCELSDIIEKVQIPVVVSGGEKMKETEFVEYVDEVLRAGAMGIAAGRNIFQSEHPGRLLRCVSDLIHNRKIIDDARKIIERE